VVLCRTAQPLVHHPPPVSKTTISPNAAESSPTGLSTTVSSTPVRSWVGSTERSAENDEGSPDRAVTAPTTRPLATSTAVLKSR
jgi:hypothetical protein